MYKRYEELKNSGIEWIGEIPIHWQKKRLKRLAKICGGEDQKAVIDDNGIYPIFGSGGKFGKANKYLHVGPSVLLGRKGTIDKPQYVDEPFWTVDTAFFTDILETTNPRFFYYLCLTINFDLYKYGSAVPSMSRETLNQIPFVCPDFKEQTQISKYLDHKTAQIDKLINDKERLIELLSEERTALINQAVTKGLDNNSVMKDSGIEWYGQMPSHWQLKRMKYLCDIGTGDKDTENREDNGEYPFYVRSQTVERISTYSFDGEAILTAGDGVGVCKVWHYVTGKFDYHQRVYRMSDFSEVLGKYLFYYLKENFEKEVKKLSAKSTVDSLRRPMFQNFLVAFGSEEEQLSIVKFIEQEEARINNIIEKISAEIELLKEYRTALISEVVTGKVDVRNEVIAESTVKT
ncbi:MAG: hypothetical protein JWR05_2291 [Mucilaginibacter sp.]|nr:hypothetical protein [Mucilaginibacter sp.]